MKKNVKDYQWPSSLNNSHRKYNIKYESKNGHKLIENIENYFQKK